MIVLIILLQPVLISVLEISVPMDGVRVPTVVLASVDHPVMVVVVT